LRTSRNYGGSPNGPDDGEQHISRRNTGTRILDCEGVFADEPITIEKDLPVINVSCTEHRNAGILLRRRVVGTIDQFAY
jgi:hypothetical protein